MLNNRNNDANTSLTRRNNSGLQSGLSPLGSVTGLFDDLYPVFAASPFQLMGRMQKDMDRLFSQFVDWPTSDREQQSKMALPFPAGFVAPKVDVSETPTEYQIELDLPGISQDAIDIRIVEGTLTISAEARQQSENTGGKADAQNDNGRHYHYIERHWGRFERVFHLPPDADEDKIGAGFTAGVLTLSIPKKQNQPEREQGRRISIGSANVSAEGESNDTPSSDKTSATPTAA